MSEAPTGTVALVFTDIQGSTALWERFGDGFRPILELHNKVIRNAIDRHEGYEVKTEGDAFMIAFHNPAAAIRFTADAQTDLNAATWPNYMVDDTLPIEAARTTHGGSFRGLRVRMGVHVGEPTCEVDPNTNRMDYLGRMVNKTGRLARAGHGGQTLVSTRAWERAKADLANDILSIIDLGEHALRGIDGMDRIRQVLPEALASRRFPPIKTPRIRQTNLPEIDHRLVGRQDELTALDNHLNSGARLITLLGPAGVGKRRLATCFGRNRQEGFPGGVWSADLSDAEGTNDICAAVADALGLHLNQADPILQIGNALLGRGTVLLILIGFDHLVEKAAETLMVWLNRAPDARTVVTSSHPLLLEIEQIVPMDPLTTPRLGASLNEITANPSVVLLRILSKQPKAPAEELAHIARILDGVPLALALTAARAKHRSWPAIRADLEARLTPPKGRAPGRAAVLVTAMAAAWDDLDESLKTALTQLCVFRGDWSRGDALLGDDAESVCAALADRGLLERRAGDGYRMPPWILQFVAERLAEQGADVRQEMEAKHGKLFAAHTTPEAHAALHGREGARTLSSLIAQRHNLAVAATRAVDRGDAAVAGPTTCGLMTVLQWQGPPVAAVPLADRALAMDDLRVADRIQLLQRRSLSHHVAGRAREATDDLESALALAEDTPALLGQIHLDLGNQANDRGAASTALHHFEAALTAFKGAEDRASTGRTLGAMGNLSAKEGQIAVAQELYLSALAIHRDVGNRTEEATILSNLAIVTTIEGRTAEARELFRDALAIQRELRNRRAESIVLGNLGDLFLETEEIRVARLHLEAALMAAREVGDRHIEGCFTGSLGEAIAREGQLANARSMMARAERLLREVGDTYELIKLICRRGHLERLGRYPERALTCLEQAESLAQQLSLGTKTKPHQAILELRSALDGP